MRTLILATVVVSANRRRILPLQLASRKKRSRRMKLHGRRHEIAFGVMKRVVKQIFVGKKRYRPSVVPICARTELRVARRVHRLLESSCRSFGESLVNTLRRSWL